MESKKKIPCSYKGSRQHGIVELQCENKAKKSFERGLSSLNGHSVVQQALWSSSYRGVNSSISTREIPVFTGPGPLPCSVHSASGL